MGHGIPAGVIPLVIKTPVGVIRSADGRVSRPKAGRSGESLIVVVVRRRPRAAVDHGCVSEEMAIGKSRLDARVLIRHAQLQLLADKRGVIIQLEAIGRNEPPELDVRIVWKIPDQSEILPRSSRPVLKIQRQMIRRADSDVKIGLHREEGVLNGRGRVLLGMDIHESEIAPDRHVFAPMDHLLELGMIFLYHRQKIQHYLPAVLVPHPAAGGVDMAIAAGKAIRRLCVHFMARHRNGSKTGVKLRDGRGFIGKKQKQRQQEKTDPDPDQNAMDARRHARFRTERQSRSSCLFPPYTRPSPGR